MLITIDHVEMQRTIEAKLGDEMRALVDKIVLGICETHDGSALWAHTRADPAVFRSAVMSAIPRRHLAWCCANAIVSLDPDCHDDKVEIVEVKAGEDRGELVGRDGKPWP